MSARCGNGHRRADLRWPSYLVDFQGNINRMRDRGIRPPPIRWYMPDDEPSGVHFGYAGPGWVQLIPLVLQLPVFVVLFQVIQTGNVALGGWTAALAVGGVVAARFIARRLGVGYYVVDSFGRPVRRASRRSDGIPRAVRGRPIVGREEFRAQMSTHGR